MTHGVFLDNNELVIGSATVPSEEYKRREGGK